eukprot:2802920-Alexandrium_andersonii.AAC.1
MTMTRRWQSVQESLRALGVSDDAVAEFAGNPVIISLPLAILELIRRGAWHDVLIHLNARSQRNAALNRLCRPLHFPPAAWLQQLADHALFNFRQAPPQTPLRPADAGRLASLLRSNATILGQSASTVELEMLCCQLDSFSGEHWREDRTKSHRFDSHALVKLFATATRLKN